MHIETHTHCVDHSGNVYVCMLDTSKAFDYVNLLTLFTMLLKRDMNPIFLWFLIYTYCNQQIRAK